MTSASDSSAPSFWPQLKRFWEKTYQPSLKHPDLEQPTLLGHSLITTSLLLVNLVLFSGLTYFAERQAAEWAQLELPAVRPAAVSASRLQARLIDQLDEVRIRRSRHKTMMLFFYKQYFVMLSMASGTALVATLLAFFISRDGWEKANNGLINAFLVTSGAAILYTQIPVLFQQELNLKTNGGKYLAYDALEKDILSYLAISAAANSATKGNETKLTNFILKVDQQLAVLNQISLDFDATQAIKIPDLQQLGMPKLLPSLSSPPPQS